MSAAAVQQQPPRSFKLAAAVCQMWQSHQQQMTSSAEQVSTQGGHAALDAASDGPLCACTLRSPCSAPAVTHAHHVYRALWSYPGWDGVWPVAADHKHTLKHTTVLLPRTHTVASHSNRVSSSFPQCTAHRAPSSRRARRA